MRVFLLDLWLDLREKRLAPIAILLVAAIVAVPIVLAKGEKNEPTPTTTTAAAAAPAPVVQTNTNAAPTSSKLQTFNSRDPFEPTSAPSTGTSTGTSTTTTPSGGTGTGTSTTPSSGGGTTGGGTTGGGTTTTPSGGGTTPEKKTVTLFTYTVDIRFGPPGDQKAFKKVQRLELIPDQDNPKVVFLGVTTTGRTAVFLVDSSLGVDTNGKCKPSADECTFLYLRPDGEHDQAELTDQDGNTFRLHLLKITRVSVSASSGTGTTGQGGSGKGGSNREPAFTGKAHSNTNDTATGDTPPGEPSQPFTFRGFFSDEATSSK
jgi:hypothetical protein